MADSEPQTALLSEFLTELRLRGIAIGIREYHEVAWLVDRWPGDLTGLRQALGSMLGTDVEEARLVRKTFDEFYPSGCADLDEFRRLLAPVLAALPEHARDVEQELAELYGDGPEEPYEQSSQPGTQHWTRYLLRYWPGLAVPLLALTAGWFLLPQSTIVSDPPRPPPQCEDGSSPPCRIVAPTAGEIEKSLPAPDPQKILPAESSRPLRGRAAAAGALFALTLFGLLYWRRTGREARRSGHAELALDLESLDDPQTYELDLSAAAPPYDSGLMDDVALLLARQGSVAESRYELDVDRSLERTLEDGLAPQLVFAVRTSAEPVLILEDISVEMRWYRRHVQAFVQGLRARGVYFDHWQFDGDARVLTHASDARQATLEQLVRQRSASPLLILSSGSGVLDPETAESATWIAQLKHWLSRAWLHPSADTTQWRRAVHELPLPVWPMKADGLMAAARHLATGESDAHTAELGAISSSPPVKPLQLARLRRLVDLAPRREVGLAELLRQEFCPSVPEAAVAEAVAAPPLQQPALIGPSDEEVREFLIAVLDRSRPPAGSGAELRWRLDRALLGVHVSAERDRSLEELAALANGPLAAEVSPTVRRAAEQQTGQPAAKPTLQLLSKKVLEPIGDRAQRRGRVARTAGGKREWVWPTIFEIVLPALIVALAWVVTPALGPWFNPQPLSGVADYSLTLEVSAGPGTSETPDTGSPADELSGPFKLEAEFQGGQGLVTVYRNETAFDILRDVVVTLEEKQRGAWFWIAQPASSGGYNVSPPIWVRGLEPESPVPLAIGDSNVADDGVASVYETSGGGLIGSTPVSNANNRQYSRDIEHNLMTITGRFLGIQIDLAEPVRITEMGAFVDPADSVTDRFKNTDQVEFFVSTDFQASFTSVGFGTFSPRALEVFSYVSVRGDFGQATNLRYRFRQADNGREGQRIPEVVALTGQTPRGDDSPPEPAASCFWLSNVTGRWQSMPHITTKRRCFEQDSCDGGLGRSGGGCYKWSAGPQATREPWD